MNCRQLHRFKAYTRAHLYAETSSEERAKVTYTLVDLESGIIRPDSQIRAEEAIAIPTEFAPYDEAEDEHCDAASGYHSDNDPRQDVEREGQERFTSGDIRETIFEVAAQDLPQLIYLCMSSGTMPCPSTSSLG